VALAGFQGDFMTKLFLAAALALGAPMALSNGPAPVEGKTPPTADAKVKFLKKCLRDVTPSACNAPAEARLQKSQ
jgi:hypothetical protein